MPAFGRRHARSSWLTCMYLVAAQSLPLLVSQPRPVTNAHEAEADGRRGRRRREAVLRGRERQQRRAAGLRARRSRRQGLAHGGRHQHAIMRRAPATSAHSAAAGALTDMSPAWKAHGPVGSCVPLEVCKVAFLCDAVTVTVKIGRSPVCVPTSHVIEYS